MERKSLLIGTLIGTMAGSILAGGIVFASTNTVSAQKVNVNYNGIHGTALVYGGTTYGELYAVQQSLNQQGIVNHWNGSSLTMDTASTSNQELATQNNQLSQHAADLNTILQSLSKAPTDTQNQILDKLSQVSSGSNDTEQENSDIHDFATGLQKAETETEGNPGNASSVIQGLLNQLGSGQSTQQSSQTSQSDSEGNTASSSLSTSPSTSKNTTTASTTANTSSTSRTSNQSSTLGDQ